MNGRDVIVCPCPGGRGECLMNSISRLPFEFSFLLIDTILAIPCLLLSVSLGLQLFILFGRTLVNFTYVRREVNIHG
jgi:hypothetical protein